MNERNDRLAIFVPSLRGGGAQRVSLNLAEGLADRGLEVDIVAALGGNAFGARNNARLRIIQLGRDRILASLPSLIRYMSRERPRSLLSVMNHANVVAIYAKWLSRSPTRLVVSEHNTLSEEARNDRKLRMRLLPRLIHHTYPRADRVVAVSEGVADDLARTAGIPRDSIDVVYNPVVTPDLREEMEASVNHPWLRAGEPPVVLAVGRLSPQKDFPTLLQAFAAIRQERPARLLILGEGPERPVLEKLVAELELGEDVALPGWVPGASAYMAHAAAFVLSSRWEGLPTVLVEALYAGLPVVATDCHSGPREILDGGRYGQLVPVGDVEALAGAVGRALSGEAVRPPRESWQRYELDRVVDQYLRILMDA